MQEAFGYPDGASGLFLTGSSMANFLALIVAKISALGTETRRRGLAAADQQLIAYTSMEAHGCIAQAMELRDGLAPHEAALAVETFPAASRAFTV
mgnify:CR=1 FL=1